MATGIDQPPRQHVLRLEDSQELVTREAGAALDLDDHVLADRLHHAATIAANPLRAAVGVLPRAVCGPHAASAAAEAADVIAQGRLSNGLDIGGASGIEPLSLGPEASALSVEPGARAGGVCRSPGEGVSFGSGAAALHRSSHGTHG